MISRRTFLETLAGGLLAAPLVAGAQQVGKAPRIGVLSGNHPDNDSCLEVLRSGFSELGHTAWSTSLSVHRVMQFSRN